MADLVRLYKHGYIRDKNDFYGGLTTIYKANTARGESAFMKGMLDKRILSAGFPFSNAASYLAFGYFPYESEEERSHFWLGLVNVQSFVLTFPCPNDIR